MIELLRRYRGILILFLLLFVGLSLLVSNLRGKPALSFPERLLVAVTAPFQDAAGWVAVSIGNVWGGYINLTRVKERNQELSRELERLQFENNAMSEQIRAYQRTERLLTAPGAALFNSLPARIIARDPTRRAHIVTVNRGSSHGVTEGAAAYNHQGLVGKVVTVTPVASRILLLSDIRSAVDAVAQETRDRMVVRGSNGPLFSVRYLAAGAGIKVGDRIISSGLGGIYPKGMVIGSIHSLSPSPGELFIEASVTPSVRYDTIEELLIIQGASTGQGG